MTTLTIPLEQYLAETTKWKESVDSLNDKVNLLEEQIAWFRRQIFGQKAEKFVPSTNEEQLCFEGFDKLGPVSSEKKKIPAHERAKRKPSGKDKITLPPAGLQQNVELPLFITPRYSEDLHAINLLN